MKTLNLSTDLDDLIEKAVAQRRGNTGKKYVTLSEGQDYRKIAKIMSSAGYKMNHATARNILQVSLLKILAHVSTKLGTKISEEQARELISTANIHEALAEMLFKICRDIKPINSNPTESKR